MHKELMFGNPGDNYIATGMMHLFTKAAGRPLRWFGVSKFSREDAMEHADQIRKAGFIVIAGTPQYNRYSDWCFWYDREFWSECVAANGLTAYPLAGGSGYPSNTMTPDEFAEYCLEDPETRDIISLRMKHAPFFVVRDPHADALLRRSGAESHLMPCTGFFSAISSNIAPPKQCELTAVVPPDPASIASWYLGENKAEGVRIIIKSLTDTLIKAGHKPVVVCHGPRERDALDSLFGAQEIFYTNHGHAFLEFYATCKAMVSCRLHATLPMLGMPGKKVVHVAIDTRSSAVDAIGWEIPNIKIQEIEAESIVDMLDAVPATDRDMIQAHEDSWIGFLREKMATILESG